MGFWETVPQIREIHHPGGVWICIAGRPGPQNSLRDQGFLRALDFFYWFLVPSCPLASSQNTPSPPSFCGFRFKTPILKVTEMGFVIHLSFHPSPSWNHFLPPESSIGIWPTTLPFWWILSQHEPPHSPRDHLSENSTVKGWWFNCFLSISK